MLKRKNRLPVLILLFTAALILASCGGSRRSDPEVTTFELNADGTVIQTIKGTLGDQMTTEGLQGYINEQLTAYSAKNGADRIMLDDLDASGSKVSIRLNYSSIEDYAAFNGVDAFIGTVESAFQKGYSFDRSFKSAAGAAMNGYTVPVEYPGLNVIVLKEAMNVVLPEKPVLVSDDITINDDGSFTIGRSVKSNIPEIFQTVNENVSYIVYKQSETDKK